MLIKIHNDLKKIEKERLVLTNQMKEKESSILEKEEFIKSINDKIKISEPNLLKYQNSIEYKEVKDYFVNELNSNNIEKAILFKSWIQVINATSGLNNN